MNARIIKKGTEVKIGDEIPLELKIDYSGDRVETYAVNIKVTPPNICLTRKHTVSDLKFESGKAEAKIPKTKHPFEPGEKIRFLEESSLESAVIDADGNLVVVVNEEPKFNTDKAARENVELLNGTLEKELKLTLRKKKAKAEDDTSVTPNEETPERPSEKSTAGKVFAGLVMAVGVLGGGGFAVKAEEMWKKATGGVIGLAALLGSGAYFMGIGPFGNKE